MPDDADRGGEGRIGSVYMLYCDETNLEEKAGDFFIYGGIAIPADQALPLTQAVESARVESGVPPEFLLKFNPKPENLDHEGFKKLKQRLIELAAPHDVKLLVTVILHDVATSPEDARLFEINRVLFHFDTFLCQSKESGIVLIDRFSDARVDEHLREKFSVGLTGMPYSKHMKLERIVGIHYSAIGQSHFATLNDIILGSLRHATNAFTRALPGQCETESTLLRLLAPLFIRDSRGKVPALSLNFSPKIIKAKSYRQMYQNYKDYLAANGIESEQDIVEYRTY